MLLLFLSGGIGKQKPQVLVLEPINLYNTIECMEDCKDAKVVGTVPKGEVISVLSQLKGKTRSVLRVEASSAAGWVTYDESKLQLVNSKKPSDVTPESPQ